MSSQSRKQAKQRFDRHLRLATEITNQPIDHVLDKFINQRVLLTGDSLRLATSNGQMMFRVTANMIARFCPKLDLFLPREFSALGQEVLDLLHALDSSVEAEFRTIQMPDVEVYATVLSIGPPPLEAPNLVAVDGAGWLALLSRGRSRITPDENDPNPFGALLSAALGVADAFKYLLQPRPEKAVIFGETTFSVYDYTFNNFDPGPPLPPVVELPNSLLAGVGAVGNAFLLSLFHVPGLRGEMATVDCQSVDDDSNLNRYLLAVEADASPNDPTPKTNLATRLFQGTNLTINPFQEPLEEFLSRLYKQELRRPTAVLSAVDNNEARGLLQKLWPPLLLEGATDATTSQVSRHEYERGLACLMCIHTISPSRDDFSYPEHASGNSGLSRERVLGAGDVSSVVTEEDVQQAPENKREMLTKNLGRPICSMLSEIDKLSSKLAAELPRQSAVSFVSMISGLLMAAELVKYAAQMGTPLETIFQMDSMYPLANTFLQPVEKVMGCYCATRRDEIRKYRELVEEGPVVSNR